MTAIRSTYRRQFQLATALFVVGASVGFVVAPSVSGFRRGKAQHEEGDRAGFRKLMRQLERGEERRVLSDHPGRATWDNFHKAAQTGELEGFTFGPEALDYMMAPRPPRVAKVLVHKWVGTLVSLIIHTILLLLLGFIFGVYPAGWTIYMGFAFGLSLSETIDGNAEFTLSWSTWYEPVWIVSILVSLLSAAVGFDMARYNSQQLQGQWFKDHIRTGLRVWGTAILPAILLSMIFLSVVLATMVLLRGNPVLP